MSEPYVYKHIDPENLPPSDKPPYRGSRSECLRDAILDVVHAGLDAGLSMKDVDEAVAAVVDHISRLHRERFKLHAKDKTPP